MRLLLGALLLLPACYLAVLTGRFGFFLKALNHPGQCSEGYLNPWSRLFVFQVPILTLTALAALVLPHWGFSTLGIGLVIAARYVGIAQGRRLAVQDMADYLVREQQLEPSAAVVEAKKTIASSIEMNRILRGHP